MKGLYMWITRWTSTLALVIGISINSSFAESEGIYVKQWKWTASDTRAGELVNGKILLRACWDKNSFSNLQIPGGKSVEEWKSIVEDHIQQSWNLYAGILIVFGTSHCDFLIAHADYSLDPITKKKWAPHSIIGNQVKSLIPPGSPEPTSPAMWLCWTYKNYTPGAVGRVSGKVLNYDAEFHRAAILSQAAHEFGHILGLVHEQDQPDRPRSCTVKMDQINVKYDPITRYDERSIMNYCNSDYKYARQSTPSCGDIQSIRYLYNKNPDHPELEPNCWLKCASGLNDDDLTKTSAALSACDQPPDQITGSLSDIPDRVLYPDDPQFGGNGDGVTMGEPMDIPLRRGEEPIVVGTVENGSTPDKWKITINIANANRVYGGKAYLTGIYGRDEVTQTDISLVNYGNDIYKAPSLPRTLEIPKGQGGFRQPSGLQYDFSSTIPQKVQFKSYSFATVEVGWWSCLGDFCYNLNWTRINLTFPVPTSFEYFNSMDENTVVPKVQEAYIPLHIGGSRPLLMDKYETTQKDYMAVMRAFPMAWPSAPDAPVENITLYDAILYCNKRSALEGLAPVYSYVSTTFDKDGSCTKMTGIFIDKTKNGYRLPTSQEWIYAFRAGTTTDFFWGNLNAADPLPYGWSIENSDRKPHPVGTKLPNQWGLYDMFGNLKEWVLDEELGYYQDQFDYQCAIGSDYSWSAQNAAGIPLGSFKYNTCGSSGSKWAFIGFRPVRNAPLIVPIVDLLLN